MSLQIFDDFLREPDRVRASALRSGFGTWCPQKGDAGLASYSGVNFVGDHASALAELHTRLGSIIPGLMFFRLTNPAGERAPVHADREYGCTHTAILYLSPTPPIVSGTGFYRHRESGRIQMPPIETLRGAPEFEHFKQQMLEGSAKDWERYDFVPGLYNRCLVFDSALIHCRIPRDGFGTNDEDSRMTWTAHFNWVSV